MLCVEFKCHIVCVMLTKVGGQKCSGEQGHVVCGCCNVCVSSVGVGGGVVYFF